MCVKEESTARGRWKPRPHTYRERETQKKKKTIRISSSSYLGKEHEMGCDRIIRKNSLPPLGSVKKNTQQRAPLQKGRRKRQNQEISKLEDQNCGQNFKILDLWRITFLSKPKASHVSSRDWWKTSSSGIECYIKLPVVIKMGVSSFQLLGAGHRASRQLPTQGNAEWTCTLPGALLSWELWRYCSNSDLFSYCLYEGIKDEYIV